MSAAGLAYVALAVRDVSAVADVFEDQLGLGRREVQTPEGRLAPLFGVGASALALFATDDPFLGDEAKSGVHHIAIASDNPEALAESLGVAPGDAVASTGLDGTRELRLNPGTTCGVRTRLCTLLEPAPGGDARIERIDHVGVASADNGAASEFFASRLGLRVESTQTDLEVHTATESFTSDRYGVVYHHRPPHIVAGLRVSFISVGDCELEFLQPFAANGAEQIDGALGAGPGNTRGDKGAIGRYIEGRGPGLHHMALKTADIDATLADLSRQGLSLIDLHGRPGSRRARIGFIHPRSLGGVLVHLVQRDEL